MELVVRHQTTYHYTSATGQVAMLLRLLPAPLDCQTPLQWEVTVNDLPVGSFSPNAFGDAEAFIQHRTAAGDVVIVAGGVVRTQDRMGVVSGFAQEMPLPVYLRQTSLTTPDASLVGLARSCPGQDALTRLHALTSLVRERITYAPGTTSSASTAAQALAQGEGVCQDQAHIFLSAARILGIPARYVTGYLLTSGDDQAVTETHAWTEAWVNDLGWVGFDPTNGICVTDHYIRLCCGLDAREAAPVCGSVSGATGIVIQADVRISEAATGAPQQMQQQQ